MFKTLRNLTLIAAAIVSSGCVTAEGVSLGWQPYINSSFVKYGGHPDRAESEPDGRVTALIVVGTLSAFRELDAADKAREYERYVDSFRAWGIGKPPQLSAEEFGRSMRGWTKMKIFGVPLLVAAYMKALVPDSIADDVEFEPAITTTLFQASGDLVAARTNADGALFIDTF